MTHTRRTVALVPIKLNNERLPGKNTYILPDGEMLMGHMLRALGGVPEIDDVFVFCSSPEISGLVASYGANFLQRSPDLDTGQTKSNEIIAAFVEVVDADIYVLAHATSPFARSASISAGVKAVQSGDHDSALSVRELREFVWIDGAPSNYDPARIPRTQDLTPWYAETSAYYAFERHIFVTHGRRVGFRPYLCVVSAVEALDVDTAEDLDLVEAVMRSALSSPEG